MNSRTLIGTKITNNVEVNTLLCCQDWMYKAQFFLTIKLIENLPKLQSMFYGWVFVG